MHDQVCNNANEITDYCYLYYVAYTVITPFQRFLALGRFGSRRAGAEIMGGGGVGGAAKPRRETLLI